MIRFGPGYGPVVVVALPLFEEANRTRAFAVTVLRALAGHGVAGALPDLPGQGDSLIATPDVTLNDLRAGFAAACAAMARPVISMGIRSGVLLDAMANVTGRYHLSPATGADLRRDLIRARHAASRESGGAFDPAQLDTTADPVELAGNLISPALLRHLTDAVPSDGRVRTVRLLTEGKAADHKIAGTPLWRRAEPDNDPAFAAMVADDVAAWIGGAKCDT